MAPINTSSVKIDTPKEGELINKQVVYKGIPDGKPVIGTSIDVIASKIDVNAPLKEGQVLLNVQYVALDPYIRLRMHDPETKSFVTMFNEGDVIPNHGVSVVMKSNNSTFKEGDNVYGMTRFEQYSVLTKEEADGFVVINDILKQGVDIPNYFGFYGMPVFTAYYALHKMFPPIESDKQQTIYISSAAGAVGSAVGQLAKLQGYRVVGSAGSSKKVDYVINDLKFDSAFNYKEKTLNDQLKEHCPNGIDFNFENVGGENLEAAMHHANKEARVAICGLISDYNRKVPLLINPWQDVLAKGLTVKGFINFNHLEYEKEFQKYMTTLYLQGKFEAKLDIAEGIDNLPAAFIGLLQGDNFGRQLVKIGNL